MDQINSLFQIGGFVALLPSIALAWRTRQVRGIHWSTVSWFWLGSLWALIYFNALHQWWSLAFASLAFAGNSIWLLTVIRYTRRRG